MKKENFTSWPWLILAFGLVVPSAQATEQEALAAVGRGNNDFSARLYDALRQLNNDSLIVSPISVSTVMAMLQAGARGDTADDIRTVFAYPDDDEQTYIGYQALLKLFNSSDVSLEMANRIYPMEGYKLNSDFADTLKDYFNAEPQQLDYTKPEEAAQTINQFVSTATHDKIKDLIAPQDLDAFTRLVLVNAIYFKGAWKYPFPTENTMKMDFYTSETEKMPVDMMHLEADLLYAENWELDAKIVSLPYKGDRLSMIIILPNNRTGLAAMEEKLKSYSLERIMESLAGRKVELFLPKFKLESTIDLRKPFEMLGLESLFTADTANLTGIPAEELKDNERLYVSKAIQKAFIEVNEEGSEAAAATDKFDVSNVLTFPADFRLNCPFTAIIYHWDVKTSLFMAAVRNPRPDLPQEQKPMQPQNVTGTGKKGKGRNSGGPVASITSILVVTLPLFLLAWFFIQF